MSHRMTALDAKHALYAKTPWHRLGNVGPIDWEDARDGQRAEEDALWGGVRRAALGGDRDVGGAQT